MLLNTCVVLFIVKLGCVIALLPNFPQSIKEPNIYSNKPPVMFKMCLHGGTICVPQNYSKFEIPDKINATKVRNFNVFSEFNRLLNFVKMSRQIIFTYWQVDVGIDIMDIQNIDDMKYTITMNAFFNIRWKDKRIIIDDEKFEQLLVQGIQM